MSPSRRAEQRRGSLPVAGDVSGGPGRHGLSTKQIESMRHAQGGACAICHRPLPPVPFVDHDHALAALHPHRVDRGCRDCVRALLCNGCNLMIGHAGDDPKILRTAVVYLELWAEQQHRRRG